MSESTMGSSQGVDVGVAAGPAKGFVWNWQAVVLPLIFWCWLVWACAGEWNSAADYRVGWLVFPLALYFAWQRLEAAPPTGVAPGTAFVLRWVLFLCAVGAGVVELARLAPLYWRLFLWAIFLLAAVVSIVSAWLAGGWLRARALWFPILFMAGAVPWPEAVMTPVSQTLMLGIASVIAEILPVLGIPAQATGTTITLANCVVGVEEACSGVRSLQSAFLLALAAGEFFASSGAVRAGLLVAGFLLATITNFLRTGFLVWAGASGGYEGIMDYHDPAAYGAMVILAGGIFGMAWMLRRRVTREAQGVVHTGGHSAVTGGGRMWALSAFVVAMTLAHGWYWVHDQQARQDSATLPWADASDRVGPRPVAVPPHILAILAPDRAEYLEADLPGVSGAQAYHFFWESSPGSLKQLYHRPDVCMPGVGWQPDGRGTAFEQGGVSWRVLPFRRDGVTVVLLWAALLDAEPLELGFYEEGSVQRRTLLRLIAHARRAPAYEMAAIMIPYSGAFPSDAELRRAVDAFFGERGLTR